MATEIKPLDQLLKELPPESQAEVRDFVESLIKKRQEKANGHLRQSWAGALEDLPRTVCLVRSSEEVVGLAIDHVGNNPWLARLHNRLRSQT